MGRKEIDEDKVPAETTYIWLGQTEELDGKVRLGAQGKGQGKGELLAGGRRCRTQKPVKEMRGTESQWLVGGTGVRQRGSLRRLLA